MEKRLRSHYESLSRVIEFTRSADNKAVPVLAAHVALVGTLAARFDNLPRPFVDGLWDIGAAILLGFFVVYAILFVLVVFLAGSVYLPRNPKTGKSLIYFEDIGGMPLGAFHEQAKRMEPESIESQLLDQIHTVSQIASIKMNRVKWACVLSVPVGVLWVILLAWMSG